MGLTLAALSLAVAAKEFTTPTNPQVAGTPASVMRADPRDIPLMNWEAPQLYGASRGVVSNMTGTEAFAAKPSAKTTLDLNTFVPITPCRLVDTRGKFSPVYAGGPFAANEVRVYRTAGTCGIPSGANRVKAVSLAITTPPTAASGDIEAISNAATLGGTVVMVIQAGQWNSATTVTGVDGNSDFKVQLRTTPGDVAIDINGYYGDVATTNTSDLYAIIGNWDADGGLFYVQTTSAVGGAIRATSPGGDIILAQAGNAIDVVSGEMRVRGAGVGTSTLIFQHKVDTAGAYPSPGTLCTTGSGNYLSIIDHPTTNGNPNALLVVTPTAGVGTAYGMVNPNDSYWVFYGAICTSPTTANRWGIASTKTGPLQNGLTLNVLVMTP